MERRDKIWAIIIMAGWALFVLTAALTHDFTERPRWADVLWDDRRD